MPPDCCPWVDGHPEDGNFAGHRITELQGSFAANDAAQDDIHRLGDCPQ